VAVDQMPMLLKMVATEVLAVAVVMDHRLRQILLAAREIPRQLHRLKVITAVTD
jgi:hypothetical protein